MARGLIRSIRHTISDIPDISAPDSSRPDSRLAPDGLSETGARAEIIWGGGFNWGNNNININRPRVNPLGGNNGSTDRSIVKA